MPSQIVVAVLIEERAKVSQAIKLFTPIKKKGRPPKHDPVLALQSSRHPILDVLSAEHTRLTGALKLLGAQLGRRRGRPPKNANADTTQVVNARKAAKSAKAKTAQAAVAA